MSAQQVFSSDDLRKKILSYVVYDVYKCSLCGSNCSPLDSILYKEKENEIQCIAIEPYSDYLFDIDDIDRNTDILLVKEGNIKAEYHYSYKYFWIHKNCFCNGDLYYHQHYREQQFLHNIINYIYNNNTPYSKIKNNGYVNKAGEDLKNLIKYGNLLFKKHKNKKTQEKAEYFENLMYELALKNMNKLTETYKKIFKNANKIINEITEKVKKGILHNLLVRIRPELFTKIIIKKYQKKDIDFISFMSYMEDMKHEYKFHRHNLKITDF